MKYGSYVRWISLKNPENLKLTNGGIVCEMKLEIKVLLLSAKITSIGSLTFDDRNSNIL